MRELFASDTLVRLLTVFLLHPDRDYNQRELVGRVQGSLYLVQPELTRLEGVGLVEKTARGRRVYYRAVRRHPAFDDLRSAFLKTVALGGALRESAAELGATCGWRSSSARWQATAIRLRVISTSRW
jgi:hypothetical protein